MTRSSDDQIRHSILYPDPVAVRAYWTQHLPPAIADLRCPSGELVYTPPEWLPLTEEQKAYLREHLGPERGPLSPEEQENFDRLNLYFTHGHIKPPQPEQVIKNYETLWNSQKMWSDFSAQIKKGPKAAAKMLMEQIEDKPA